MNNKRVYKIASLTTISATVRAFYRGQFEALNEVGVETTVICAPDSDLTCFLPDGVRLIPVGFTRVVNPLKDLAVIWCLYRLFRQEQFDLVQYATPKAALLGSLAAFAARIPVRLYLLWGLYYEGQTGLRRKILACIEWLIGRLSTHVLPNSHEMMRTLVEQKIISQSKCEVLLYGSACGIDFDEYDIEKWRPQRREVRTSLGLTDDDVLVGIFGRLTGDKGINETVKAFHQLAERIFNVYLLVIGEPEEKDKPLPETLKEIQNHPRIFKLSRQESLLPFYTALDIVCLPTYREGFPQTHLEAQAMMVPVVSTDINGVREAVAPNETGLLVEPKNVEALIESLEKLIIDKPLRRRMGYNGRIRTFQLYNQKDIIKAIVQHRLFLLEAVN